MTRFAAWSPLGLALCLWGCPASHAGSSAAGSGGSGHAAGSGSAQGSGTGTAGSSGSAGATNGSGGTTGDHGAATGLAIGPQPAVIAALLGRAQAQAFTATATYADGATAPVAASWTFDRADLATVDGAGLLTTSSTQGGEGTLRATFQGLTATAPVSIQLQVTRNDGLLSGADQARFDTPDAQPSGTLLYPYDRTVFPQGLLAPELMWSGGAAGDGYRITLAERDLTATLFVRADPPSRAPIPQDVWDALTETNPGGAVSVDVARLSGGQAHTAMHQTWTIAPGSLRGAITYWSVGQGQLMKISPGHRTPAALFDPGAAADLGTPAPAGYDQTMPPWSTGTNGNRCVACHTVSKDGSTAVSIFERKDAAPSPWGTLDLTTDGGPAVVQMSSYDTNALFVGLSPDGRYAVPNDTAFTLKLFDAHSGALIASALDGLTDKAADPAFSPSGELLAFAGHVTGSYPVEYTQSDLSVMDFDPDTGVFANRRTVVPGDGGAVAFPSFTPDSASVIYQYGDYSRAKYGTTSVGHDDLYLADLTGAQAPVLLANASGAGLDPRDQHLSYQPTVNPISVGGYTWVVFVSPRDYGNALLSTADPTYENRKQLWVAAVDAHPQPGQDPSHPAFWLPGQDLSTINMSGYWSLEACHAQGTRCDQGYECCSGFCQVTGGAGASGTCVAGPTGGCSQEGEACTTTADCCGGQDQCIGGFCSVVFQ